MAKAMPIIDIPLDCGHTEQMEQWDKGDRRIDCNKCGRIWIVTAAKAYVPIYQTKTEIKRFEPNQDEKE